MRWTRRAFLAGGVAVLATPARAETSRSLVAIHIHGVLPARPVLVPEGDDLVGQYGDLRVGMDVAVPAAGAFFLAWSAEVAVVRGLRVGHHPGPRRTVLCGTADEDAPDLVTRVGPALSLGADSPGGLWRSGPRALLGGLVDPSLLPGATWVPTATDRAAVDRWLAGRGEPVPSLPYPPAPASLDPARPPTLVALAETVPRLLDAGVRGVRIGLPDATDPLAREALWTGLDQLLGSLGSRLADTLILVTADRTTEPVGPLAVLLAGGLVRGGRGYGDPSGGPVDASGDPDPGGAVLDWSGLAAGAVSAVGGELPGVTPFRGCFR